MLRNNSPTLQNMIDSVRPGTGNFTTVSGFQGQFQTPYPSPKDMVMQAGMNPYGQMPLQQPVYPQQNMYQQQAYSSMYGFSNLGSMVGNVNGIPMELEYNPSLANQNIGNERTLHTSGLSMMGQSTPQMPGRYMNIPPNNSMYGAAMTQTLNNNQQNIVGGYNGYKPYTGQMMSGVSTQPMEPQGRVVMYDGKMIHPHANMQWYGSPDFPLDTSALNNETLADAMRNKFNEKFPGYTNPYMTPGFGVSQQPTISREMQDTADIAAFYGMSYSQFVGNGVSMMKKMSRSASHYFGNSEEETNKREKLHDPKKPRTATQEPDNDEELFYPNGAFDIHGQLTREYQGWFCVSQRRLDDLKKKFKVAVKCGDELIPCKKRPIDFATSRAKMDMWAQSNANYIRWLENNKYASAYRYWNAPERKLDNLPGNAFQVTSRALGFADQMELEAKWRSQRSCMSSNLFNRDEFIMKIKEIRQRSRENAKEIDRKKFDAMIHRVAGHIKDVPTEPMFICDGDWVIAKPGCDICGVPLEQSVNKIIRINTRTEEEEIYDPNKPTPLDIRERLKEASKPAFNDIDDDELERRLTVFNQSGFRNYTDR